MRLTEATGPGRGSRGRQRRWGKATDEREQQEQSCGQLMHGPWVFEAYQLAVDECKNEDHTVC
jgi:hypothetical protein